ncbi:AAA family ATPase [Chloroflexi bacterium TSY]|nr:AAA family ATPase [Chloroflexi bacterium TSY]
MAGSLLVEQGPDMVDTILPSATLIEHAQVLSAGTDGWLLRLKRLVEQKRLGAATRIQQSHLFEQCTTLLCGMATRQPLLLILDDLHWVDSSSAELLFHLARRLAGSRILLVGTYRPEDVAHGRNGEPHPLTLVTSELKGLYGDVWISLNRLSEEARRRFVDLLIGSEPNHLDENFRQALFRQTSGHALFTVELLRDMQERGDLVQDENGCWIIQANLDWASLPAKVEGIIERRIERLTDELRESLTIASVEGEDFTAEVIARIQAVEVRDLVRRLSTDLVRRHRLVRDQGVKRLSRQRLSLFRFRHNLFQQYIYNGLSESERAYLHEDVGRVLESLYGDQEAKIAPLLARHFELAGLTESAIHYLQMAGEQAFRISANAEAVDYFAHALTLMQSLDGAPDQTLTELRLQVGLSNALLVTKGYASPQVEEAFLRAETLCQEIGDTPEIFPVLYGLWTFFHARADHQQARSLSQRWLSLAKQRNEPMPLLTGHRTLGVTLLHMGEFEAARTHLDACLSLYKVSDHNTLVAQYGLDPGAAGHVLLAWTLWLSGDRKAALTNCQTALDLVETINHPFSQSFVQIHAAILYLLDDDAEQARKWVSATLILCKQHEFPFWLTTGMLLDGWLRILNGQIEKGIKQMEHYLERYGTMGARLWRPWFLSLLAKGYARAGDVETARHTLATARELSQDSTERWSISLL